MSSRTKRELEEMKFCTKRRRAINSIVEFLKKYKKENKNYGDNIIFYKAAHSITMSNIDVSPCGDLICFIFGFPVIVCFSKYDDDIKDMYERSGAIIFDIKESSLNETLCRFELLINFLLSMSEKTKELK